MHPGQGSLGAAFMTGEISCGVSVLNVCTAGLPKQEVPVCPRATTDALS